MHLVRTIYKATAGAKVESLAQLDTADVIEHALNVLKNLPGGFYVFGVFFVTPKDIFSDASGLLKIKSLIFNLQYNIKANATTLRGDTDGFDGGEKLVLWYSSSNNACSCKAVSAEANKGAQLRGVDWKFIGKSTQWVMVETFYEIDEIFHLQKGAKNTDEAIKYPIEKLTKEILNSRIFYNGVPQEMSSTLGSLLDDKKLKEVKADIYKPQTKNETVLPVESIQSVIKFHGTISSRVWVPTSTSFVAVDDFIKDDICRSLGIRLQILIDSLVDDKVTDNEVLINEPPRRIYFPIKLGNIQFCEYLFPSETAKTVLTQIKENLDIDLKSDQILTNLELIAEAPIINDTGTEQVDSTTKAKDNSKIYIIGIIAALVVLLLSMLIHYTLK